MEKNNYKMPKIIEFHFLYNKKVKIDQTIDMIDELLNLLIMKRFWYYEECGLSAN